MAQSAAHKHDSTRRATYQDVLDAPAHRVAEIIDGTLHTHPRPAMPHARASSSLGVKIGGPFDYDAGGPGGWWIIDEPELHLGEEIVVPDLAGWRRERMPEYPDTAYVTFAPDWVCEVLSASTRKVDLHEKRPIYAREPFLAPPELIEVDFSPDRASRRIYSAKKNRLLNIHRIE